MLLTPVVITYMVGDRSKTDDRSLKALMYYQALSYDRHTLTPPSESVLCLTEIELALFSSDTVRR